MAVPFSGKAWGQCHPLLPALARPQHVAKGSPKCGPGTNTVPRNGEQRAEALVSISVQPLPSTFSGRISKENKIEIHPANRMALQRVVRREATVCSFLRKSLTAHSCSHALSLSSPKKASQAGASGGGQAHCWPSPHGHNHALWAGHAGGAGLWKVCIAADWGVGPEG